MKRLLTIIANLAVCLLAVQGCEKEPKPGTPDVPDVVHVQSVSISASATEMTPGEVAKITVTITPSNASDQSVTFTTDNSNVVAVDSQGNIMAQGPGTATITVTTKDGSKIATVKITVKEADPVVVTGVTLNETSLELTVGDEVKLVATVEPSDATDKEVTWSSSDEEVATVDQEGNVKVIKDGEATITVTTKDGGKTASCTITATPATVAVTGIKFQNHTGDHPSWTIDGGSINTVEVVVLPADASNKEITCEVSDASILEIRGVHYSESGGWYSISYKGLDPGTATLTVTTVDGGYSVSADITVIEHIPVTSLTFEETSITLVEGETGIVNFEILPENATQKRLTVKYSDPLVCGAAKVSDQDAYKIITYKPGTNVITFTTYDSANLQATVEVTVLPKETEVAVNSVSLEPSTVTLTPGESYKLVPKFNPENATNQAVSWISSNTGVATVDEEGNVTAKKKGQTTITVTTQDGGKTATCLVKVIVPVTGVSLSADNLSLKVGESQQLTASVQPSNASDKSVTWKSADKSIATVDSDGNVTAVKVGSTTITVTTKDGGKKASCQVTVTKADVPVTGVEWRNSQFQATMNVGESQQFVATVLPSNATNKNTTITSSDPTLLDVLQEGPYTATAIAKKAGTCNLVVTTEDGGFSATCKIIIKQPVTGVSVSPTSITIVKGQTAQLTAAVEPSDASDQAVTWSSSNTNVARVNTTSGQVAGVNVGTATITVTTHDGQKKATCEVTVINVPVFKLQTAKNSYATNWTDVTDYLELNYKDDENFIRLYDTANNRVVNTGTFTFSNTSTAAYMENADSGSRPGTDLSIYSGSYWRVVLRTDGWVKTTLTYHDPELNINFSRQFVFYYKRPLDLSDKADCSSILNTSNPITLSLGSSKTIYIRHATKKRSEVIDDPSKLEITCVQDDGTTSQLSLSSSKNSIVINPKKKGTARWNIKYENNGVELNRTVRVTVE